MPKVTKNVLLDLTMAILGRGDLESVHRWLPKYPTIALAAAQSTAVTGLSKYSSALSTVAVLCQSTQPPLLPSRPVAQSTAVNGQTLLQNWFVKVF